MKTREATRSSFASLMLAQSLKPPRLSADVGEIAEPVAGMAIQRIVRILASASNAISCGLGGVIARAAPMPACHRSSSSKGEIAVTHSSQKTPPSDASQWSNQNSWRIAIVNSFLSDAVGSCMPSCEGRQPLRIRCCFACTAWERCRQRSRVAARSKPRSMTSTAGSFAALREVPAGEAPATDRTQRSSIHDARCTDDPIS